jgi:hypothetical protein
VNEGQQLFIGEAGDLAGFDGWANGHTQRIAYRPASAAGKSFIGTRDSNRYQRNPTATRYGQESGFEGA